MSAGTYVNVAPLFTPVTPSASRFGGPIGAGSVCAIISAIFTIVGFAVVMLIYWKDYKRTSQQKEQRRKMTQKADDHFAEVVSSPLSPDVASPHDRSISGFSSFQPASPVAPYQGHANGYGSINGSSSSSGSKNGAGHSDQAYIAGTSSTQFSTTGSFSPHSTPIEPFKERESHTNRIQRIARDEDL